MAPLPAFVTQLIMNILIINGPNLNLLGKRETSTYGDTSFEEFLANLRSLFADMDIDYYQSNVEGEIVNKLQETGFTLEGIVINAGAYTHTSVAIADAIKAIDTPVVEVHISNILSREAYRHTSLIAPSCKGSIMGFGLDSYRLGIESLRFIASAK